MEKAIGDYGANIHVETVAQIASLQDTTGNEDGTDDDSKRKKTKKRNSPGKPRMKHPVPKVEETASCEVSAEYH